VRVSAAIDNRGLSRRFKASFCLSAINLCAMALPTLRPPYHWVVLISGIVVNVAACWLILRNVEPSGDPDIHARLAAFGRRSICCLGLFGVILMAALGLTERLGKQALPFILFGFGYFAVALKVLGISIDKTMEKLRN
jgi:hypothetical protein